MVGFGRPARSFMFCQLLDSDLVVRGHYSFV